MTIIRGIKKAMIIISTMFIIFNIGIIARAAGDNTPILLVPKNIKENSNGSLVKYSFSNDNTQSSLNVDINSQNLKKGYYTTNIYSDLSTDWSTEGMMSFDLSNQSNSELRLNLTIRQSDGTNLYVPNDKSVFFKKENSELLKKVYPTFGAIDVPIGFKGTLSIPFSSLGKQGLSTQDKIYSISKISSWGIFITTTENEEKIFSLSNINLIKSSSNILTSGDFNFTIQGDSRIQLPVNGESIGKYKANITDLKGNSITKQIKYEIDNPQKGISIGNDGILKVEAGVAPQKIIVNAIIGDSNIYVSSEIELFQSWTVTAKPSQSINSKIPKTTEVPSIISNTYKFLISDSVMNGIRIVVVVISVGALSLYLLWKRKNSN